jgi:hypothetical protein
MAHPEMHASHITAFQTRCFLSEGILIAILATTYGRRNAKLFIPANAISVYPSFGPNASFSHPRDREATNPLSGRIPRLVKRYKHP